MGVVYLVDISFLNVSVWDFLDVAIVSYLLYRIYKLLRGSIAFNIFTGLLTLYVVWWIVNALKMQLLSTILSQFVGVGMLLLIIVFQPEIRSFLIDLGQNTFGKRLEFFRSWLNLKTTGVQPAPPVRDHLLQTIRNIRKSGRDAVFVLDGGDAEELLFTGGLTLNTEYSRDLVESVTLPESALKQGAIVIQEQKLHAVGARFPHSENPDLPVQAGVKHRLGVGATESADVGAVIVSSEDQTVSTAYKGYLAYDVPDDELERFINAHT